MIVCKLSQEREVSLPGRLPRDRFHQITCQAVVMHSHHPQLRGSLIEKFQLPCLAAIRFKYHQLDSQGAGVLQNVCYCSASDRLDQFRISHTFRTVKSGIILNDIFVEAGHVASSIETHWTIGVAVMCQWCYLEAGSRWAVRFGRRGRRNPGTGILPVSPRIPPLDFLSL